jgi:hypothetical protein
MALLSRAVIRKRVISLATTTSVAATSFALAQDPSRDADPIFGGSDRSFKGAGVSFGERRRHERDGWQKMTINPTGDVDRDFVGTIVHHKGRGRHGKSRIQIWSQRAASPTGRRRLSCPRIRRSPSRDRRWTTSRHWSLSRATRGSASVAGRGIIFMGSHDRCRPIR